MSDIITLYHGTTHDFSEIDVNKGKPFKDFGQGFYLSQIYEHARNIAFRNRRIVEERLRIIGDKSRLPVFIYSYEFDPNAMSELNVKRFKSADIEWVRFVVQNRNNRVKQHNYDVVIGATANDNTRTSIRAVTNMTNNTDLSDAALNVLLEMLEPENLPEQYYFGTTKATSLLKFTGREELRGKIKGEKLR